MFKILTVLFFVIICAVLTAKAQKTNDKSADETAMRANVAQMMNGWNAKSGEQFAKPFADDADYVIINGGQIKSRKVIAKAHQGIFDTIYKNSSISLAVDSIRFLKPDVALVHVTGTLTVTENNSTHSGTARQTLVMMKTSDKWEIAAFQNTEITTKKGEK